MHDVVDRLRHENATLRERVRQLEEALASSSVVVPIEWGLTPSEARLFAALTTRDIMTKEAIMTALYSDRPDDDPEKKIVDVYVCKIRAKVQRFGVEIITVWGQGYSLADRQKWAVQR